MRKAKWIGASIGGNGGTLEGGESVSSKQNPGSEVFPDRCKGGTQTKGSNCTDLYYIISYQAIPGEFGTAGVQPISANNEGYGAYGGGGYYGGTSYRYAFAGSGGSSFISGYEGCKAVKEQTEFIEHTNTSYHYSGFVFTNTKMIPGNETMPLPTSSAVEGIHSGEGAFRITLIMPYFHCTYKQSLYSSLIPNIFILISFSINKSS